MGIYNNIWTNILKENKVYKKIAILILLVSMSFAQEKIGVVFSERILEKSTEFNDLAQQAQLQEKKIIDEYNRQLSELQTLAEEIDENRLAWTPDLLKAKEQEFQDMKNALERYLAGAQDEFTKWQRSADVSYTHLTLPTIYSV